MNAAHVSVVNGRPETIPAASLPGHSWEMLYLGGSKTTRNGEVSDSPIRKLLCKATQELPIRRYVEHKWVRELAQGIVTVVCIAVSPLLLVLLGVFALLYRSEQKNSRKHFSVNDSYSPVDTANATMPHAG